MKEFLEIADYLNIWKVEKTEIGIKFFQLGYHYYKRATTLEE